MKSVLIIEKPTNCIDCPMQCEDKSCGVTETSFMNIKANKEILPDCPLRDLPKKQAVNEYNFENYANGVNIGWNRCLSEITGEQYEPPKYEERNN